MNRIFYPKLAVMNMKKNRKFYIPYMITCIVTVAMYFIMCCISDNSSVEKMPGSDSLIMILGLGSNIVAVFSVIFLFYTNSFLMKRRKKELGLYNILGMEKKHIAKVLFWETLYLTVVALLAGIGTGVLFYKAILLVLSKILRFKVVFGFELSILALGNTILLFGIIFLLILSSNLFQIWRTRPIELLHGGNIGEKEPKAKWGIALLGVVCIGAGYYIAITTESPLAAVTMFFVAVLLVMIGTYCLFTSGSIWILKLLKKNKKYYYQTKHFTSISGLMYRMKQNAVGLANICILSTMVLVMLSATVSLYIGSKEELDVRYPYDVYVGVSSETLNVEQDETWEKISQVVKKEGRVIKGRNGYEMLSLVVIRENNEIFFEKNTTAFDKMTALSIITKEEYEAYTGEKLEDMKENEIYLYTNANEQFLKMRIGENNYQIKSMLDTYPGSEDQGYSFMKAFGVVVKDKGKLGEFYEKQKEILGEYARGTICNFQFDIDGTKKEKIACAKAVKKQMETYYKQQSVEGEKYEVSWESKQEGEDDFYSIYGGFLFLGILLGTLFLMATTLIIYYKQISEGYEDKEKFVIMEKVGMTKEEIKGCIRSQVLKIFFLPILVAGIHVVAAFPMLTRLLVMFNLTNRNLFIGCTLGVIFVFYIFYGIVYGLTAKVYYKIVS